MSCVFRLVWDLGRLGRNGQRLSGRRAAGMGRGQGQLRGSGSSGGVMSLCTSGSGSGTVEANLMHELASKRALEDECAREDSQGDPQTSISHLVVAELDRARTPRIQGPKSRSWLLGCARAPVRQCASCAPRAPRRAAWSEQEKCASAQAAQPWHWHGTADFWFASDAFTRSRTKILRSSFNTNPPLPAISLPYSPPRPPLIAAIRG